MGNCKGLKGSALKQCLRLEKNVKIAQERAKKMDSSAKAIVAKRKKQDSANRAAAVKKNNEIKKQALKKASDRKLFLKKKTDSIVGQRAKERKQALQKQADRIKKAKNQPYKKI